MKAYSDFAKVYDKLMSNIPYNKWLGFIEACWERHGLKPGIVLDLACGTGSMTVRLAKKGYDCIGIDDSSDMLDVANKKAAKHNQFILFSSQSMTDFELYGSVDAIICLCDSVNYLTGDGELSAMLKRCSMFLDKGGVLIFDVITLHKFENIIAGNSFSEIRSNAAYVMNSYYDEDERINEYALTVFYKKSARGDYERFDEFHVQRAYERGEIEEAIAGAGMKLVELVDEKKFAAPKDDSERLFYVCMKE